MEGWMDGWRDGHTDRQRDRHIWSAYKIARKMERSV